MNELRLSEAEVVETSSIFEFADGNVTVIEREVHEFYRPEKPSPTRLIIGDAFERTKCFVSKTRAEFQDLNAVLKELAVH